MDQRFEPLLCASDAKQFVAQFREVQARYTDTNALLADLVSGLAPSLYQSIYDQDPHGFYGLTCAAVAEDSLPESKRWRPYAQQLWALRKERRRTPFALPQPAASLSGAPREERWAQFEAALRDDFPNAFGIARSFLCEDRDRNFFRARSLVYALGDLALGGHKFNYLAQSWLVAERLGLKLTSEAILGSLHLLANAPQDRCAAEDQGAKPMAGSRADKAREKPADTLVFGDRQEVVSIIGRMLANNTRSEEILELLLLAAAQTLACAARGRWLPAARAFHTASLCRRCFSWFTTEDQPTVLLLAAVVINQAAKESRVDEKAPSLDETIRKFCPTDPFAVLKSVISHSDPYASATAVYAILGMDDEKKQELPQALLGQALKNDGDRCWGHDVLYVSEAWDAYSGSQSSERDLFPAAAGFLLGQVLKSYQLAAEYGV